MNPQLAAFAAAVVLAVLAGAWRALSDAEPETVPAPTTNAATVEFLTASAPHIAELAHFNVNNLNPFVPIDQRTREKGAIESPPTPPQERAVVRPPPVVVTPPPLVLPPRSIRPKDAVPDCVGLVAARSRDHRAAITVRMHAGAPAQAVAVGDTVDGWRLDAVDGPTARWTSPAGESRIFVIAPGAHNAGGTGVGGLLEQPTSDGIAPGVLPAATPAGGQPTAGRDQPGRMGGPPPHPPAPAPAPTGGAVVAVPPAVATPSVGRAITVPPGH